MDPFPHTIIDTPGPANNTNSPGRDSLLYLDLEPKTNISRFLCQVCNKPTLSCCVECKSVFYCSAEHQLLHWSTHQYECKPSDELNSVLISRSVLKFDTNSRKPSIIGRDRAISRETVEESRRKDIPRRATEKSEVMDRSTRLEINEKEEDISTNNEAINANAPSEQSLSRKERTKKLHEVLRCYMKLQQDQASLKARKLLEIAKELFETDEEDVFEFLGDGLLLVKCLLTSGNIQGARENLIDLWKIALEYVSDKKIECKDENNKVGKLGFVHLKRGLKNFVDLESLSPRKKQEVNRQIQKTTNLFSAFAVLFYTVGDFKNCEEAYIRYVKVIEANFGGNSFECSNCYFLVGVFYLEQKYYVRAMACFKRALKIRQEKFGDEMHEPIADCYYNMAIIYKQTFKTFKAMTCLNTAFKIRSNLIGEFSLPVAQVLELVGKILQGQEDYRTAWTKFQECLLIRRKILNEDSHPDIQRVKILIQDLTQVISAKLHDHSVPYGKREALFQLQKEIDGKKSFQDYRTGITGVSEIMKIKEPVLIPKASTQTEYIAIDEDDNKSPSKIANSLRTQDFMEAARSQEFETIQRSETALERSLSKNSAQNQKGLSFNRIRSSTRTEQETDPHETLDAASSVKHDRSPADSVKRATFGIAMETELLSQNLLRADIAKLQSSPSINVHSPNQSSAKSGGVRKPTKSVTTMMDRGHGTGGSIRRSSDNTIDKTKGRRLNLPDEFLESLTPEQTLLLGQLNAVIKGNVKEKLDVIVSQSDFFKCLLGEQKEEFLMLNQELGLGYNV